jgi:hypothetical protein
MARAKGIRCEAVWDGQTLVVRRGGALLHEQPAAGLLDALDALADWQAAMEVDGWRTRRFSMVEGALYARWNIWLYRR